MSESHNHSDDDHDDHDDHDDPSPVRFTRSRQPGRSRWWVGLIVLGVVAFIAFGAVWSAFFHFVPTGKMLVIIAKNGDPLPAGQVLAEPGQKGVQAAVLGEGWHFVWPIIYATELKDNVMVPAGKVGIVTAQGGVSPRDGRVLAVEDDEQGIRQHVLTPGAYRLNPYGFSVELADATEIHPGYVGVLRRRLGNESRTRFADDPKEKGILRQVLQPGLYYLNTKEFEVIHAEVGIDQTTYSKNERGDPRRDTAISFPAKDGNTISLECTIEWEVLPEFQPQLVAEYGDWHQVERNVIDQQARRICRDRGFNYGAQDFLDGEKREVFQNDFAHELERVCKEHNVVVRSAFIRNIIIPDEFLKQKRERQLAAETRITNEAKEKTAQSDAEVERERRMIDQRVRKVQAETGKLVAEVDQQVKNLEALTEAEVEKLKADYNAQMANLDAQRQLVLGGAEAEVKTLKDTATSSIHQLKLEAFRNDGNAYLRYTLAKEMNPQMVLRLFHAGPGTFWTNLDGKGVSLMLPAQTGGEKKDAASPK
jgi:uncharacterized membrane protein YqiK